MSEQDRRTLREALDCEQGRIFREIRNSGLFASEDRFASWRREDPWRVRTDSHGTIALLDRWRDHLSVMQVQHLQTKDVHLARLLGELGRVATEHGMDVLLSPLLAAQAARPYVEGGLVFEQRLVPYRWRVADVARALPPQGVSFRDVCEGDLAEIVSLETECFGSFWQHGPRELVERISNGRFQLATEENQIIGYTLTTLTQGRSATLGRVAVRPSARRRGVARALISEATEYAARAGVRAMSLCTQESNDASRALYASLGLTELVYRLVLASDADVFG